MWEIGWRRDHFSTLSLMRSTPAIRVTIVHVYCVLVECNALLACCVVYIVMHFGCKVLAVVVVAVVALGFDCWVQNYRLNH